MELLHVHPNWIVNEIYVSAGESRSIKRESTFYAMKCKYLGEEWKEYHT